MGKQREEPWCRLERSTAIRIGSALVHADELIDSLEAKDLNAIEFDVIALIDMLESPHVKSWLESFPSALLPRKRKED